MTAVSYTLTPLLRHVLDDDCRCQHYTAMFHGRGGEGGVCNVRLLCYGLYDQVSSVHLSACVNDKLMYESKINMIVDVCTSHT